MTQIVYINLQSINDENIGQLLRLITYMDLCMIALSNRPQAKSITIGLRPFLWKLVLDLNLDSTNLRIQSSSLSLLALLKHCKTKVLKVAEIIVRPLKAQGSVHLVSHSTRRHFQGIAPNERSLNATSRWRVPG